MSKRLLFLNLVLVLVSISVAVALARELSSSRQLPPPRAARETQSPPQPADPPATTPTARSGQPAAYSVIAARNLFHPSRSEAVATPVAAAPPAPPAPKPFLHGVVVDEGGGRAYLEEPLSKKVFGYRVGDSVGGGRLEKITPDRVLISRPEGNVEVLLRDPARPKPAAPPPAVARPGAAGPPSTIPFAPPQIRIPQAPEGPGAQAAPVTPPRPLPLPPHLLRRPPPTAQPQARPGFQDEEE